MTEIVIDTEARSLREQMQAEVEAFKKLGHGGWQLKAFVLQHGRPFEADRQTLDGKRMKPKECFANALRLTLRKPWLVYCEGFVDAGLAIPIHHAWTADSQGRVSDPTLTKRFHDGQPRPELSYFGIPFQLGFVMRQTMAQGTYGLLDAMSQESMDLILGRIAPEEFRENV